VERGSFHGHRPMRNDASDNQCDLRPRRADRYQPAANLSGLLDERTQVLRDDRAYGRCRCVVDLMAADAPILAGSLKPVSAFIDDKS
jgi:hypothetical protein